jgi:hypothetical protein
MRTIIQDLLEAVIALAGCVKSQSELLTSGSLWSTKQDVEKTEHKIMSKIAEFAAAVNEFHDSIQDGIDGIQADVTALKTRIEELQSSLGENIPPESQAILDDVLAKIGGVASRITELDSQTPGVAPGE